MYEGKITGEEKKSSHLHVHIFPRFNTIHPSIHLEWREETENCEVRGKY